MFGRLSVKDYGPRSKFGAIRYVCECKCGNTILTIGAPMVSGVTQSCGCWGAEIRRELNTKHGHHKHPLYQVWASMKNRCFNPNDANYRRYGGKGISVYSGWIEDYVPFHNWAMTSGYQSGLSLGRRDIEEDYSPQNCIFVTAAELMQNTSLAKITAEQVPMIRADPRSNAALGKALGVNASQISRIRHRKTWGNIP